MTELEQKEQAVRRAIAQHRNDPNFPQFEDYGGDEDMLDDYFYLQKPQGSMEEEKRKLTIYGMLIILPIVVMSFFDKDLKALIYGLLIGGVLSALYYALLLNKAKRRERSFREANIEKYIEDVLNYKK